MKKLQLMVENEQGELKKVELSEDTKNKIKKYSPVILASLILFQLAVSILQSEVNQDYTYFLFALLTSVIETVALIVYFTTRFARTKFIKLKNRNSI